MKFHDSLLDILSSKTKVKIVKFLLAHEASMSEREIASILKVSHMSINRAMQELAAINFTNFISIGKAHLWKVNRKSYAFKCLSELMGGISCIKDPLDDLKTIILKNLPKSTLEKIILFGSVADGSEKTNSDIDIFILVKEAKDKEKLNSFIEKLSNLCLEIYGNRLAPYVLTEAELRQNKSISIISEINKGIQIFPEEKK